MSDKLLMAFMIATVWITMVYILVRYPLEIGRSMSQHIARQYSSHRLFIASCSIVLLVFYILMVSKFLPALHISKLFLLFLTIGTAAQLISTWIPDTIGKNSKTHRKAAYTAAAMYPLLLLGFSMSANIPAALRIYLVLSALIDAGLMMSLKLQAKTVTANYLAFQLLYIAIWHTGLLLTVFAV